LAEFSDSASTEIVSVSVPFTWDVMDVEKNIALDLLNGDQFDDIGEHFCERIHG